MSDFIDFLPTPAIRAFTTLFPTERRARRAEPHKLRLAELDQATAALEVNSGEVILRLARDGPFGEISPAYLALFVYRLAELSPDVGVAYLEGYHHPIVATLKLEVPADASVEAWKTAIPVTLARLEGALSRQDEAARDIKGNRPAKWIDEWPEVAVSPEQLNLIASFADRFASASLSGELQQLWWVEENFHRYLRRLSVLRPGQSWLHCLRLDELRSGFFDGVSAEHFTASQLVVTLNAIYEGNAYNTTLVNRACSSGLLSRLTARARELVDG